MMQIVESVDVVVGLSYGDEGKGKVTAALAKENRYDFVARWAGGNNAGHTVFINNKKYKTHLIPSGVFYGIKSIIGPGCVLHPESFLKEIEYLEQSGFDSSLVKVSPNCHIVLDRHIAFDQQNLAAKLGTTSKGIAPAYADKAARVGIQAKEVLNEKFLMNFDLYGRILCEGAQGVWLDINHGIYPYVTSSETFPYAACSLGFSPKKISRIYGVAKVYDTRSGEDPRFPNSLLDDPVLMKLGELGQELGVTTGRRRKVNWLNLDWLVKAINLTGTTDLILNKCDVLEKMGVYRLYAKNQLREFSSFQSFLIYIEDEIFKSCPDLNNIQFSSSPENI